MQRHDPSLEQLLHVAEEEGLTLVAPAAALTEFLGGSPRALRARADWVASFFTVATIDEVLARRAATLIRAALDLSPSAAPSAVDGLVAAEAERRSGRLAIAGDRKDFEALAEASGQIHVVDVEEWVG